MRVKCLAQEHNTRDPGQGLNPDLLIQSLVLHCVSRYEGRSVVKNKKVMALTTFYSYLTVSVTVL